MMKHRVPPVDAKQSRRWVCTRLQGVIAMLEDAQTPEQEMYARIHLYAVTKDFDNHLLTHHKQPSIGVWMTRDED